MRDSVGLVGEVRWIHLVEILEEGVLQNFRVEGCHAVDCAGADDGQVGHAHRASAAFINDAHAGEAVHVIRVERGDLTQEARVDLVNDLHVTRKQMLHQRDAPGFKRLRQDGVVGVAGGFACDLPGGIPRDILMVHEQAHQFRDDERRMGFVQMDEGFFRKVVPVLVRQTETAQDVLQRTRHKEVLLTQAQFLAGQHIVVRIEDLGQILRQHLILHGIHIRALVEFVELELIVRLCRP